MVEIAINGRLGNQLFMYAMARTAQLESNNDEIFINTSIIESEGCANSLLNYNLPKCVNFYSKKIRTLKKGFHGSMIQNLVFMSYIKSSFGKDSIQIRDYELKHQRLFENVGFFPSRDFYSDFDFKNKKNILLHGYYQSEKFFEKYKDIILKELTPKQDILEHNVNKMKDIKNSNSVCVSLRLGEDYRKNEVYNVCTTKYFKNAIELIKKKIENPIFYVFSDVTEGLENFFDEDDNMIFETGNDPDYEKLRIMSACKHFIISNSSFSWWAQYLSTNKDKIVIAPERWYNKELQSDIMMHTWIKLEV